MNESKIVFILSGKIRTGKTTSLVDWVKNKTSIGGLLQPVINNCRYIVDIASNEQRQLELIGTSEENSICVGKYIFSKSTFEWAKICLLYAFKQNYEWLIVDEIGKLELDSNGLEPVISYLLDNFHDSFTGNYLFVVRDYLVETFMEKFCCPGLNIKIIGSVNEL